MINNADDRGEALARIEALATELGLDQTPVRGKIIEYLFRFRQPHYDALVEAGVI